MSETYFEAGHCRVHQRYGCEPCTLLDVRAQLEEAKAVLREVEWASRDLWGAGHEDARIVIACPSCHQEKFPEKPGGHAPDCRLKKALG